MIEQSPSLISELSLSDSSDHVLIYRSDPAVWLFIFWLFLKCLMLDCV